MTNIIIHGVLGKIYGTHHKLNVRRLSEIIPAINANNPGFKHAILSYLKSDVDYCYVDPKNPKTKYKTLQEALSSSPPKEVHIVPSIVGAGAVGMIVGGLALAGVGTYIGGTLGGILFSLGVSLILQGIIMLLFPPEDPKRREVESKIDTSTYIFSNRVNNAVQGFPVPLVYGELRVGSNIISTNIVREDMG